MEHDAVLSEEREFNLSDFALFLSVMKNKEAYESTLSIIADDPVLKSGKRTRYRELPSSMVIFITMEDIFEKDSAIYTFTEQCIEFPGLPLEDGTTKVFLNMTSKNGRPELVSLLQYMKNSRLDNPEVETKDPRILKLAEVVEEVKQSEEWEAVRMSILSIGIERGKEIGRKEGLEKGLILARRDAVLELLSELGSVPEDLAEQIARESNTDTLKDWLKKAAGAKSIEEFQNQIQI